MNTKTFFLLVGGAGLAIHGCSPDFSSLTGGPDAGSAGIGVSGGTGQGGSGGSSGTENVAGKGGNSSLSGAGGAPDGEAGQAPVVAGHGGSSTRGGNGGNSGSGGRSGSGGTAGSSGGKGSSGAAGTVDTLCGEEDRAVRFGLGISASIPRSVQDDFTIEAWIQTATSPSGVYFWQGNAIAWADTPASGLGDFGISVLGGKLVINIGAPDAQFGSISDVTSGRWVHVAVTRTKITGTVQVFVNGVLETTGSAATGRLDAVEVISLGSAPSNFFDGLMDELRLWEIVRTPAEIQDGMLHLLAGSEPGLVGYYRFDEIVDSTLHDSSGNGRDGSVSGPVELVRSSAPVCADSTGSGGQGGEGGTGGTG